MTRILPQKRSHQLAVAIPASFVSDIPHHREKTYRIGLIGRAIAIFRVSEIIVFPDLVNVNQCREMKLIATILSYMETPQYLRKRMFKMVPELRYAGTLPPLRTPHHPIVNRMKKLKLGEYREGAIVFHSEKGSLTDIGVEQPILIERTKLPKNMRVTVKISELSKFPRATLVNRREIKVYWGYKVTAADYPLGRLLKVRNFDLAIATSRKGKQINNIKDKLILQWKNSRRILVVFGAPTQGLYEIAANEHKKLEGMTDFVVNTIPYQATETVRTEEALLVTLSILNTL